MAKVLLVGLIREHLEERRKVLLAARLQVHLADSLSTAYHANEHEAFDVAVLGYSIPEQERNQLALALKQAHPEIKIIMIYFSSIQNTDLADALLPTTAGAEEVLRAVNHILRARTEREQSNSCSSLNSE
jgi:DNA-binding NtrC family response regulator